MARPEKPIDWKKVDQLLLAGCHGTEIAPHFDIDIDTFYRKVQAEHNIGFTAYSALKRNQGDSLLKAKQYEKAMSGDNTLLIWLGKSRLKQRDYDFNDMPPLDANVSSDNLKMENEALKAKLSKYESNDNQSETEYQLS